MKLLQARVSQELYFAAKEQAAKEHLSLGEFFSKVVEAYILRYEEDNSVVAKLKEIGEYKN